MIYYLVSTGKIFSLPSKQAVVGSDIVSRSNLSTQNKNVSEVRFQKYNDLLGV